MTDELHMLCPCCKYEMIADVQQVIKQRMISCPSCWHRRQLTPIEMAEVRALIAALARFKGEPPPSAST